jgi:P27 family predicted phage terminase small subunit
MTTKRPPPVPKGLSAEAGRIWRALHAEFVLTDAGAMQVLDAGLRAFDVLRKAEGILASEGLTVRDRYNTAKAHPAVDIAKTARTQWLSALRMLGLHREGVDDQTRT